MFNSPSMNLQKQKKKSTTRWINFKKLIKCALDCRVPAWSGALWPSWSILYAGEERLHHDLLCMLCSAASPLHSQPLAAFIKFFDSFFLVFRCFAVKNFCNYNLVIEKASLSDFFLTTLNFWFSSGCSLV